MSAVSGFYAFAKGVLTPIMTPWVKFSVTGEENLPTEGGFLLVSNHLSNVGIYPEGTLTRDPDQWPMEFKSGAARLALDTGVTVIPLSQWGPQDIMAPYNAKGMDMRPGRRISYHFGEPVDLSDLMSPAGSEDHDAVNAATARILQAVREGVGQLRGLPVPDTVWDPATQAGPWWEEEQAHRAKKAKKAAKKG